MKKEFNIYEDDYDNFHNDTNNPYIKIHTLNEVKQLIKTLLQKKKDNTEEIFMDIKNTNYVRNFTEKASKLINEQMPEEQLQSYLKSFKPHTDILSSTDNTRMFEVTYPEYENYNLYIIKEIRKEVI